MPIAGLELLSSVCIALLVFKPAMSLLRSAVSGSRTASSPATTASLRAYLNCQWVIVSKPRSCASLRFSCPKTLPSVRSPTSRSNSSNTTWTTSMVKRACRSSGSLSRTQTGYVGRSRLLGPSSTRRATKTTKNGSTATPSSRLGSQAR